MRNIGAVILAAGASSRFGQPKQLLLFRGQSFVRRMVNAANESGCQQVAVVVGSHQAEISSELGHTHAFIIENKDWPHGIGTSIRAGVKNLIQHTPEIDAIVLLTCDQPFVDASLIKKLMALWKESKKAIVASAYAGTLGVPALFDRSCFRELIALNDENGAKPIILLNRERVAEHPFPEGKIDIDTAADYEKLQGR